MTRVALTRNYPVCVCVCVCVWCVLCIVWMPVIHTTHFLECKRLFLTEFCGVLSPDLLFTLIPEHHV